MSIVVKMGGLTAYDQDGKKRSMNVIADTTTEEQVAAVRAEGERVIESIPQDYHEMDKNVRNLIKILGPTESVEIPTKDYVDRFFTSEILKVTDYLYEYSPECLDYNFAKSYYENQNEPAFYGGCSSVRKGSIYGRNFDWLYSNNVEFVVKTPANNGRHATIGVTGQHSAFTKAFVESRVYVEAYRILPFMIADGVNDAGLACNINVVALEKGSTTGTTPSVQERDTICSLMLPRYILDNFADAKTAAEYVRDYISVYSPDALHSMNYEVHFMVSDKNATYAIELVENSVKILDITAKPYLTNFYLYGTTANSDGSYFTPESQHDGLNAIVTNKLTPFSSGVERYNLINADTSAATAANMRTLLNSLKFTNAYKRTTTPFWYSEFVGGARNVASGVSAFTSEVNTQIGYFNSRQRDDGKTWQSSHSAIYDLDNCTLTLNVQEQSTNYEYKFDYASNDAVKNLEATTTQLREDLSEVRNADDSPAASGQVWTATENGAEWSDPQGVADVQIAGTSIVSDGVANVGANTSYGIGYSTNNKTLFVQRATNDVIRARTNGYTPITPVDLDFAVKTAMCDGVGAAWSADEQAAARVRMGNKQYRLIAELVVDGTPISRYRFNVDHNNKPFKLTDILILWYSPTPQSDITNYNGYVLVYNSDDEKNTSFGAVNYMSPSMDMYFVAEAHARNGYPAWMDFTVAAPQFNAYGRTIEPVRNYGNNIFDSAYFDAFELLKNAGSTYGKIATGATCRIYGIDYRED